MVQVQLLEDPPGPAPESKGYQFLKKIGCGSQGEVWKCKHSETKERVAVKIISYKGFIIKEDRKRAQDRGEREILVGKFLRHPNIVICYDGYMIKKEAYLIMEFMKGGTLRDYVEEKGGNLSEKEARKYFHQLIHGVSYCHRHLVVHRDLKPTNLLLDASRQILKIVDFGLCNYCADDFVLNTHTRPDIYRAPEMTTHRSHDGELVDVYCCGVILYGLLVGLPKYTLCIPYNSLLVQVPSSLSADGYDIIKRMIATEPNERLKISQVKDHPWFKDGDEMFLHDTYHRQDDDEIDRDVLQKTITKTGHKKEEVIEALIENKHSEVMTTYKLLRKRKLGRMGMPSSKKARSTKEC